MPRVPFTVPCRVAGLLIALCLCAVATVPAAGAVPTPVIKVSQTVGQAPLTVHVHALDSTTGGGASTFVKYRWSFGDPNGRYNSVTGWNAAHVYNKPGNYTIKLTLTNKFGQKKTVAKTIKVTAPQRNKIFVSPAGNDNNPGTKAAPVRTVQRAFDMIDDNTSVYFQRGGTYNMTQSVNLLHQNVLVGAYGSGSKPVIRWNSYQQWTAMVYYGDNAKNVTVQDLEFDSISQPNNQIVRALNPNGNHITIRRCHFAKVSYAVNCELIVEQFMMVDNTAGVLGAYLLWAVGSDHVVMGNKVAGSVNEHNIRLGGVDRMLIARNDLTNPTKSTIWAMLGNHCYIHRNVIRKGRVLIGPNHALGNPWERYTYAVVERNHFIDEGLIVYAGAENVMVRNNVIDWNGETLVSVWGWHPPMSRTTKNVSVLNNTGIHDSAAIGRFITFSAGAENLVVANNLYCAAHATGVNYSGNAYSNDATLDGHKFRNNSWTRQQAGAACHHLGSGWLTSQQWANAPQASGDRYRQYSSSDLNGDFDPTFNARFGLRLFGVFDDFYGKSRPKTGKFTVGAVE